MEDTMKHFIPIVIIALASISLSANRKNPSQSSSRVTRPKTVAAMRELIKDLQKHNDDPYNYEQFFKQTPNSQRWDAKEPYYKDF